MILNYSVTKITGTAVNNNSAGTVPWVNPGNITADDNTNATITLGASATAYYLHCTNFGFDLPDFAIIDRVVVNFDGSFTGGANLVWLLNPTPSSTFIINNTLTGNTKGQTTFWGYPSISYSDVNSSNFGVRIQSQDAGADGASGTLDSISITIDYHLEFDEITGDVPTRVDYKVFSREGEFLGLLPNVTTPLAFSQDINSAGSILEIQSATDLSDIVSIEPLLTESELEILTEDNFVLLAESTDYMFQPGYSDNPAVFKNSNRVEAWLYNYWHPNGINMFSGQVNKVSFNYGGVNSLVDVLVISDGMELNNYIARGLPPDLTTDVSQTVNTGTVTNSGSTPTRYGQTFVTGAINQLGAISLLLRNAGTGNLTAEIVLFSAVNGTSLGSAQLTIPPTGSFVVRQFMFSNLVSVSPATSYFFTIGSLTTGQELQVRYSNSSSYANGQMYYSEPPGFAWTSFPTNFDMYFVTYEGELSTEVVFTNQDPVTGMLRPVLRDYNDRGGRITERSFQSDTGANISYRFSVATIYDVYQKVLDMSVDNHYGYIDLGTGEMDFRRTSLTPDILITKGKDINEITVATTIEELKNNLLFTGGPAPTDNLYRSYTNGTSVALYGPRLATKTDNRVTLDATANAIGQNFLDQNSEEVYQTEVAILDKVVDITLLTPGKTIGFRNFGNFLDGTTLQIMRRDYQVMVTRLTLGKLPTVVSVEMQRFNKSILDEQTLNNPGVPS